jgi:transposase-like protein
MFHGTRRPLRTWFRAMLFTTGWKTGVSARSAQKLLGLGSYQTAWTWLHKIRSAMVRPDREPLAGWIEVDEAHVGGVRRRGSDESKPVVAVAVEYGPGPTGRIRLAHVDGSNKEALQRFVKEAVEPASYVKTDGHPSYRGLSTRGYRHKRRVVGQPERASHVLPYVHRAIALLKRWLLGTYQGAVRPVHLQPYLDEFAFRFNRRRSRAAALPFERLCAIAVGRRSTTYPQLVAQTLPIGVS